MESKTAYPLTWPQGRPRFPSYKISRSRFDTTFARARQNLIAELDKLRARDPILSTNIELRLDGLPYANRAEPNDRGVAVYFTFKKRDMAFACDRWDRVGDNIHAIALSIGALRGIDRWGTGDMMEAAFTGFTALPDPAHASQKHWREILECPAVKTRAELDAAHRVARSRAHPDRGGSDAAFHLVQVAYEQACREIQDA